jgi:hypothetical protein
MSADPPPPADVRTKPPHPLPVFCWIWPAGALLLVLLGGLILHFCFFPPPKASEEFPPDHPRWNELRAIGAAGVLTGAAWGWFAHRFAVKRRLTRALWNTGAGLILIAAAFLFLTGWILLACLHLVILAFWAHGETRRHFDAP